MSPPLISVALATCDGASYLEPQLDSIFAQDWPRLEVVVSDDASSDDTIRILEKWQQTHGLILHRQAERTGLVRNFEAALQRTNGELIALSDQDDVWKAGRLRRLVEAAEAIGGALAYSPSREVLHPDGRIELTVDNRPIEHWSVHTAGGRPVDQLLAENWIVGHQMLIRRRALERSLPFPGGLTYHDGWLAACAAVEGPLAFVTEPLQLYRRHAASVTYKHVAEGGRERRTAHAEVWRDKAARESVRLAAIARHRGLPSTSGRAVTRLLAYYRSGIERGHRLRSFTSGLMVGHLFWSARTWPARARFLLRPLLLGR
jgi:glycosyltransferase involved in cell wall biosynthesis